MCNIQKLNLRCPRTSNITVKFIESPFTLKHSQVSILIQLATSGARGDVQNFSGCQAPAVPVLTQALQYCGFSPFFKTDVT